MAIPREFIERLIEAADITDIINGYVALKRTGALYKGLCPFHSEKTPSFTVFPSTSSFFCFGCQAGGDAITFLRGIEHLDYVEAVKLLAGKVGMDMPEDGAADGLAEVKRRMREANREAARYFHRQLFTPAGSEALEYLKNRGLDDETIAHFGLGWSPDSWDGLTRHLRERGFREDEILGVNLARMSRQNRPIDVFRNRVMFPIIDLQGSVIAFGGRTMSKEHEGRKYVNTSDTLIYKKSRNLYALNWAKNSKSESIVVTEGYMDVIAMWQAGFDNAIASQGTAFTDEQARLLVRNAGGKQIILSQDGDEAGQRAIKKSIPVIKAAGGDLRVLDIPENLDPDEYIRKYGPGRMKKLLESSRNDIEYSLSRARTQFDMTTDDGRLKYLRAVCDILAELKPLEREVYAVRISDEMSIDKSAILSQIKSGDKRRRAESNREQLMKLEADISGRGVKNGLEKPGNPRAAKAEEALLLILFRNPDSAGLIKEKLPPERMLTDLYRRLYSALLDMAEKGEAMSISAISQSLSLEEMGQASRIFNTSPGALNSVGDADKCIEIILNESECPTGDAIAEASAQDIQKYLESLKKRRD